MPDTRIAGARNDPEPRARIDRAVWILELGVIEKIEELSSKFEVYALAELRVFVNRQVPIVQPGTVEESPVGISNLAHRFWEKRSKWYTIRVKRCLEPTVPRLPWVEEADSFTRIVRPIGSFATTQ